MHEERIASHTIFVQPGKEFPDNTDWNGAGGKAILFPIVFKRGVAEVPDNLGRYMIDKELAAASPIIVAGAIHA